MALYRQEDLDDQFVADARKTHEDQLAAMEKCIDDSAKKTTHQSDESRKRPDPIKVLTTMMMLGMMAKEMTGYSYTLDD